MKQKVIGLAIIGVGLIVSGVIWGNSRNRPAGLAQIAAVANSPQAVMAQVNAGKASLIDVRTDAEWSAGHAAAATHFDVTRMESGELPALPKDLAIYLYCRTGHRAGIAKTILEQNGYTNVVNLGGLSDWQAAGGPVE